ncbi:MAG TPA: GNAT family N-acetyltransferase [Fimbriimonadales bacterium]|nr:GNAT family N-acetyltransferase [Fimbriimonadales bacterium]
MTPTLTIEKLEALRNNFAETMIGLARGAPRVRITKRDGYWMSRSPFEHPIANFAVRLDLNQQEIKTLVRMATKNPSFRIYVMPRDNPAEIGKEFESWGLVPSFRIVGMALERPPLFADSLARLAMREEREEILRFIVEHFFWKSPRSIKTMLFQVMSKAKAHGHEMYVVRDEKGIVAVASIVVAGDTAGLYNICVRNDMRGKGLGSELVRQLSWLGASRGLKVVLQCEKDLENWYFSLGFTTLGEIKAYSSAAIKER